jgi:hypothetical protein
MIEMRHELTNKKQAIAWVANTAAHAREIEKTRCAQAT